MKRSISILDNINITSEAEKELQKLADNKLTFPEDWETAGERLIERASNSEAVLISPRVKITESFLAACPSVKYIGLCGTSAANVDLEAIKKHNIIFTNIKDYGDEPAAEYMFMLLLELARGAGKYQWRYMPVELMGKSIGIIGLGALGKAFANLALGFKMDIFYYSLYRKENLENRGVEFLDFQALLKACDVITICTPTNVKVLGKEEFNLMKPNSILMYASAGEALDKEAFLEWIKKDNNYALFNISAGEGYYHSFKNISNVIFPKVMAGYSRETKERLGQKVIENLQKYLNS